MSFADAIDNCAPKHFEKLSRAVLTFQAAHTRPRCHIVCFRHVTGMSCTITLVATADARHREMWVYRIL